MITAPEPALYWAISTLFCCLIVGSASRFIALRNADEAKRRQRLNSLRTWWMLSIFVSIGLLTGRPGICVLLCTASCIAWFELTRMLELRPQDQLAIRAGYGLIICSYLLIMLGMNAVFGVFLPVSSMIVLSTALLLRGEPQGFVRSAGGLLWGMLFLGYGVSHAAFLMIMPATASGPAGPAGWLLFLVVLTETDDIFQAITGRLFGAHKRHRISPTISPNKTWEGFFGGMLVIVVLAPIIAPWLTTLGQVKGPFDVSDPVQPFLAPMLVAVLISIAGFFGDVNMSAIKRDAGVKDSSNLLPGMGGVIDRVDSLTMTAPVYVCFLSWWLQ